MRTLLLATLFTLLFFLNGHGQNCLPNGITFSTQADIDNFSANYPGCTVIEGNVMINGGGINNLNGLSGVTAIGGNFYISLNYGLTNLSGLGSIISVGGDFIIEGNPLLTSLSGLGNISSVGGDLRINTNSAGLTNLNGLEKLESIGGDLYIFSNDGLTSLNDLEKITSIGGSLYLNYSPGLTNLNGLENITSVEGGLYINDNYGLTSLSGLENITSVGGDLYIYYNPVLTGLSGLENITSVGGNLTVDSHPMLTSLGSLANITTVGGNLTISILNQLTNLSGLENITTVGGSLYLSAIGGLTSLTGLHNVKSVGGDLTLSTLINLGNLSGLDSIIYVGGNLIIDNNFKMTSLTGLDNLTFVGGGLSIFNNTKLTSLDGLHQLSPLGEGFIDIQFNELLSDCAIHAVCDYLYNSIGIITLNLNAPGCNDLSEIEGQCVGTPVVVTVLRDNNGDCLPDASDTPVSDVQVYMAADVQRELRPSEPNGVARFNYLDDGPFSLRLPHYPTSHWAVCQDSVVINPVPGSQDTVKVTMLLLPLTQCPELTVSLGLPSNFRGCLVNSEVQVAVQNTGTVPAETVKAAVVIPSVLEVIAATPPSAAQNGDTLFFYLDDMSPFATKDIKLIVKTDCDSFLFGQTLCVEAFADMDNPCPETPPGLSEIKLGAECIGDSTVRFYLKNIGEAPTQGPHQYAIIKNENIIATSGFSLGVQQTLTVDVLADGATYRMEATKFDDGTLTATAIENCRELTPGLITAFWLDEGPLEYDFDCRQVIGSYDPNQKTAVPTGTGSEGLIVANQPLQYTIDFQNTGTDTAFRVLLRDLLPPYLDINTFRPGFSSHPCTWEINGHRLEVLFSPIALPDSNVNEPASHGFFSFTIDQKPDLPDGTNLENAASIIFDFNPPIVTNTVRHTIGKLTVQVDEAQPHANLWRVWGNPLRDAATFRTEEFVAGEKRFGLYDVSGRLVRSAQFSGQAFELQRNFLPGGLYFFRISDARGRVFAGKVVVADE